MAAARASEAIEERVRRVGRPGRGVFAVCAALMLGSAALALAGVAGADDSFSRQEAVKPAPDSADDAPSTGTPEPAAKDVPLDDLLKLPDSMSFGNERRAGGSADEWRRRFRESNRAIVEATDALEATKRELDEMAGGGGGGGQWQVAPPGSNQTEIQPMSFKLREEVKRNREKLAEAKRRHRALEIEADLAGVPESWREGS